VTIDRVKVWTIVLLSAAMLAACAKKARNVELIFPDGFVGVYKIIPKNENSDLRLDGEIYRIHFNKAGIAKVSEAEYSTVFRNMYLSAQFKNGEEITNGLYPNIKTRFVFHLESTVIVRGSDGETENYRIGRVEEASRAK
jgi:hypothetical protein